MTFSVDPRVALWQRQKARLDADEPPPNWKNPPVRHHYVPEMYLKRFARLPTLARKRKKRDPTPLIVRIEPAVGPVGKVIGIRDAAVETDFYTIETDDPRRVSEAEHTIGLFETAAGYAFANLNRDPGYFPDGVDRENLSHFLALQFVRGHDTADFQERFYTQTSRMILRVAAATPGYVRSHLIEQGKDASDEAVAKHIASMEDAAKTVRVGPNKNETVEAILKGQSS